MIQFKKIAFGGFVMIGMFILLYLMTETLHEIQRSYQDFSPQLFFLLKMSLWGFLFGVLIEWRALGYVIKGHIHVSWLLLPAIILMVVVFIPWIYWAEWFGLGRLFVIEVLGKPEIHMLLTVFSGVLFIRSVGDNRYRG
ncbi:hypothetical protein P4H67_15945 [Paenibacillus lautus]|uniref:hypothetical protein n=1 Tax=Paenibacillus lautus TaxID=1401 RepID=UPI002DBA75D9|nr:hypothetical protein [Paenibacillus lautus]MEC0308245.1 hypothetical protein [Paenibacillus lautus]